jgi:hypothetical protein
MKTRHTLERRAPSSRNFEPTSSLPDADALAALRGWYAGLSSRETVVERLKLAGCCPMRSADDPQETIDVLRSGRWPPPNWSPPSD